MRIAENFQMGNNGKANTKYGPVVSERSEKFSTSTEGQNFSPKEVQLSCKMLANKNKIFLQNFW